ncbi:MAG: phosphoribosyltransferase [Candidatus Bathyarchaeia archaeon]
MAKRRFKLLHLTWDDIQLLAEKVAEKVDESGFRPDVIVAVSRGGFDPARILCDQLFIQLLASLQIEYYDGVNRKSGVPKIVFPLNADVEGQNVLVVDDVSDTGNSLRAAREHVTGRGASEVKVGTLHVKPWTTFRPDYYASEVDAWIVYPWETMESIKSIAESLREDGLTMSEIKKRLNELGFTADLVKKLPQMFL